jgi:hypothetical protein
VTPPRTGPPVGPPIFQPPLQIDPGVIHIDPAVLAAAQPVNPAPDPTAAAGGAAQPAAPPSLPALDIGGQLFEAQTVTHPETGATTTVFAPVSTAGMTANLAPVAGGGFHLTPLSQAAAITPAGLAAGAAVPVGAVVGAGAVAPGG